MSGARGGGVSTPHRPKARGNVRSGNFAAIDLGTNNCRLLIARPTNDGLVIIDAFSRIVRLGEGLGASGVLHRDAMDRAVQALAVCADKLRRRNVHLSRAVATQACRQARNGRELVERVRRETGIVLDIIGPEEEARLAVAGCHALLEPGDGPALIFDIGGGSTELVLTADPGRDPATPHSVIADWVSVPWGVVSLTEAFDGINADDSAVRLHAYAAMKDRVRRDFAAFAERLPSGFAEPPRLLGTSGTVTTLASVHLGLPRYDRRAVDGLHLPAETLLTLSGSLAAMHPDERQAVACIGSERAGLVVAGCAILEAIASLWPAPRIGIADRGIREGILRGLALQTLGPQTSVTVRR